jgi:hypothetical protein
MFSPSVRPADRRVTGFLLGAVLLWVIAAARIISTYGVFSQTFDEPAHIAAGMEWLDKGTFTAEPLHPPLARVAVALGPFLTGARSTGYERFQLYQEGNEILYSGGQYSRTLALARLGILPFFLLATSVVCIWTWMLFGRATALLAVLLFTTLPPVLAHAGLATTDLPLAATLVGALLAFVYWLNRRTLPRSLLLGAAIASALVSKLSALLFLPSCGLALLLCHWLQGRDVTDPRRGGRPRIAALIGPVILAAFLVVWGVYRFSVRCLVTPGQSRYSTLDRYFGTHGKLHDLAYWVAESVPIPAADFSVGVYELFAIRYSPKYSNTSYLLGKVYTSGKWYYFPVVLAVKSPIPFLLFAGVGLAVLGRERSLQRKWSGLAPGLAALVLLVVCLPSKINLGGRYILAVYPLLAITAGFGAAALWNSSRNRAAARAAVVALLLWQLISSARIHPDYLAYFNEFAGGHPDRILVDSDLDWGQDLLRLADTLRMRGIDAVSIAYFGTADLSQHNLPRLLPLEPHQRERGWIAISETAFKMGNTIPLYQPPYDGYSWLEDYQPVAMVGRSIRLYYLPPERGIE